MKKAGILLTILLFSMLTAFLTIIPPVIAETSDPQEMNSGMGRPYQDLTGVVASSDGINLTVSASLAGAPPKADEEEHVDIYVAIDTDNETNSGSDWFPHHINARYGPALAPDGPGGGHYYWEYCVALHRWTKPELLWLHLEGNTTGAGTIGATNSTDGTTVNITIPLASIGNPTNVTLGVVTAERVGTPPVGEPSPPTNFAHIFRDTIGNASFNLYSATWGQWLEVEPAIIGLLTSAGSSDSASDPTGDFAVLPCNDLTEVEVGQGSVIINVTMADMTYIWGKWYMFDQRWQLVIAVDIDGIPGSGQAWMPGTPGYGAGWKTGLADVRIDPAVNDTYWERAIVIDDLDEIHLYDTAFNDLGDGGITATQVGSHKMKIEIPVGALALAKPSRLNITVVSGQDWYNLVNDVVGTWSYEYNSIVNTQGYFLVQSSIPPTEEIYPIFPGGKVPTPPSVIGRPYQDIREAWAKSDGTNLSVSVTLDQGPPKRDNETHVNIHVAIDNGTTGGSWWFPDDIDVGYVTDTYFWEYCLALYNWTGTTQDAALFTIDEYVSPPRRPSWTRVDALAQGVTVTNSTNGKTVNITIPLAAIGNPSTVTIGVVTSEDYAKVKDTVGSGYVRTSLSQWVEITPAITGLSTAGGSSDSASDPAGDFAGKSFWDITGVAVEEEYSWILVNVTFQNLTTITWSMDQWRLAIGIDTDHAAGSGQDWMAFIGYSDTRIDESINDAYWERCVVLDSTVDVHVYNTAFEDFGSSGIWAELMEAQNTVRVHIPNWILPPSADLKLNLTIISGMDGGDTVYDVYGSYAYAYSSENTQGFYNLTTAIVTGPVMYPFPLPTETFNTAMGRGFQDITDVWAKVGGTNLNVSVTLRDAPPKADAEAHVNVYLALDTADGGQDWFPDEIDVRYNLSEPEHNWEYCLALYSWTGATQDVDLIDKFWTRVDALANPGNPNVTVTNSTDGKTVNVTIPLALIGSPSNVTIGAVTSEDGSKIKDTVGVGTAIILGWQWIEVEPAIIDLSSSDSAADPTWDFCGKSFWDITGVTVSANATDIIVKTTFLNITGLSASMDHWWMSIAMDLDHVTPFQKRDPFIYAPGIGTDTLIDPAVNDTLWDIDAVINSLTEITLFNATGDWPAFPTTTIDPHGIRVTLNTTANQVIAAIPRYNLVGHNWDYNISVTVIAGTDHGNRVYDVWGTYTYGYRPGAHGYEDHGAYEVTTTPALHPAGPFKAELRILGGLRGNNIYKVNLDLDQYFLAGDAKIVAYFYTYADVLQTSTLLLGPGIILPRRITMNVNITHPQGKCISKVKVVLETDLGAPIMVIATFVADRSVLSVRTTTIDILWSIGFRTDPYNGNPLFLELVDIDTQWPYAPG